MAPRTLNLATATCAAAAAAAAAAACYFYRRRRCAATVAPRVLVASTSEAKLAAVKAALGAREVTSLPAPSLVEDQPIGTDRCVKGLSNRLKSITAAAAEGYDYAVAMESGLVRLQCAPPRHHATTPPPQQATRPPGHLATKQARRARTRATRPKPKPVPPHLPPPLYRHHLAATALPPPPYRHLLPPPCRHRPAAAHVHRSLSGTGGPPERWLESALVVVLDLRTGAPAPPTRTRTLTRTLTLTLTGHLHAPGRPRPRHPRSSRGPRGRGCSPRTRRLG